MTLTQKGLVVAALHVALVASLGAKLLIDRATYPRVWVRAAPVDPELPVRGRYVSLRLEVTAAPDLVLPRPIVARGQQPFIAFAPAVTVRLTAEHDTLIAHPDPTSSIYARARTRDGSNTPELTNAVAYFIPEGVPDPSRRNTDEELWVEVTVPPKGLPRPIQLGVKRGGVLTPLALR